LRLCGQAQHCRRAETNLLRFGRVQQAEIGYVERRVSRRKLSRCKRPSLWTLQPLLHQIRSGYSWVSPTGRKCRIRRLRVPGSWPLRDNELRGAGWFCTCPRGWLSSARLIATAERLSKDLTEPSHKTIYLS
jgi:hypothetical protein